MFTARYHGVLDFSGFYCNISLFISDLIYLNTFHFYLMSLLNGCLSCLFSLSLYKTTEVFISLFTDLQIFWVLMAKYRFVVNWNLICWVVNTKGLWLIHILFRLFFLSFSVIWVYPGNFHLLNLLSIQTKDYILSEK